MQECTDRFFDEARYAETEQVANSTVWGRLCHAQDQQTNTPVTLLELPSALRGFLSYEQVLLRYQLFQDDSLPLLRLLQLNETEESVCAVFERIPGAVPLDHYLADKPLHLILEALIKLCDALSLLHARAMWHGGIVPSYVYVLPSGEIRLLPMYTDSPMTVYNMCAPDEQLQYFAPETMPKGTLDSRTEIYNLGVMFYYVLTGHFPFSAAGGPLYPPSRSNPHIPPHLDRLILKMINVKPTKRFQWITQVIHELARMIGRNDAQNAAMNVQTHGSQHMFSAEFTGRVAETEQLLTFLENVRTGETAPLLVTGRVGVGRRRLVYEVVRRYIDRVTFIISGGKNKAYATVEELTVILLSWVLGEAKMESIGRTYVGRLARVFPRVAYEFREKVLVFAGAGESSFDQPISELIVDFFCSVAQFDEQPMVFVLHDAHHLDEESLQVLLQLCATERASFSMIVVTEEAPAALSERFPQHLHLQPLPLPELRECVLSRFGEASFLNQDFMQWLSYHSQGSLGAAFQLLDYLADTGQLYLQRDMWHMRPATVEELNIPQSMESLLLFRMGQLSPLATECLQLMSLFQGPFLIEPIARVLNIQMAQQLLPVLLTLEEQGLILHMHSVHLRYRFPSNNTKQHICLSIPEEERKQLHCKLGREMIAVGSTDIVEIAHQFREGEDWQQAILFHILAARRSLRQQQLSVAEAQIAAAIELYDKLGRPAPHSLYRFHTRVLELQGKISEAVDIYRARYEATGSLFMFVGMLMNSIIIKKFNIVGHYVDDITRHLASLDLPADHRVDLMIILGMYNVEIERNPSYILVMDRYQNEHGHELREQLTDLQYINWLANLQVLLRYTPDVPRESRIRYLYEAATLAEHHNFKRNLALVYCNLGIEYHQNNPRQAKDYYLKAAKMTSDVGDTYSQAMIYNYLVDIHRLLGDMTNAFRYLEMAQQIGAPVFTQALEQEVNLLLFVENYEKAEVVIRRLVRAAKSIGHQKMREYAFLYLFQSSAEQGLERRIDRMWPHVERICDSRNMQQTKSLLRAQYDLLKGNEEKVVCDLSPQLETADLFNEETIKQKFMLIEALIRIGMWEDGLEIAGALQEQLNKTDYFGYFAWIHFDLGRLFQLADRFVQSTLNYKQAIYWFRKMNHHNRILDIEKRLHQADQEMIRLADRILLQAQEQTAAPVHTEAAREIAASGPAFSQWVRKIVNERYEVVESLTQNEIVLDALRRVSSSIMVKHVCDNLAGVMFENLLIDRLHLHVNIGEARVERFHFDEQLHPLPDADVIAEVEQVIGQVLTLQEPHECVANDSHLYALPILSHDEQVIAVIVLEKLNSKTAFTGKEKRFMTNMTQLVSSNIENSIMYEAMITDTLTGLYARHYFMKRLNEEMSKVQRYGIDLSFLMIDLDNFRLINNEFGHNEGDRVLRVVAKTLRQTVRDVDIVGRFGGEELIVILPNTGGTGARTAAERLLDAVRQIPVGDNVYNLTASIGVASVDRDRPADALDLIEKADRAEIHAKRNGKNQVVCHWEMPAHTEDPSA